MATTRISLLPRQMVSDSVKKTDKWKKDNLDAFENLVLFENRQLKNSYYNKLNNYNLKRGILNMKDVEVVCDPHGLGINSFPAKMQHMGIGNSKIDLLVGENIKRKFDWKVVVSNVDGISRKEEDKMNIIREAIVQQITADEVDEQKLEQKMKKLDRFLKYEFQDIAEKAAYKVLDYTYRDQYIKETFDKCFEDALISGEQYIFVEEFSNEIRVRKGDPLRIFTLLSSEATDERGLECLVEIGYHTISSLVDMFHDNLSEEDLSKLDAFRNIQTGLSTYGNLQYPLYGHIGELAIPENSLTAKGLHTINDIERSFFATNFDVNGNIRLMSVIWRSKRKVKKLRYLDEMGIERFEIVHEHYTPDESKGETIDKELWINEWWRGYKIGNDIYPYNKIEPIPFLATSLENVSKQGPPVIIQFYNTNSSKSQSLMDIIKPFDYLYDIFSYRRELLVNKLKGDILVFPTTMIPDNMTMSEFMNYVETTGDMPLDPAATIIDGPKAGLAAGQVNNTVTPSVIGSTQGGPIAVLTEMMRDIMNTMDIVSGITQQRQGAISSSELVGNVERSIQQSSYTTERWFAINDFFKKRVLKRVLDVQVALLKKNPRKLQYILDDLSTQVITDDEIQAVELSEFDLHVSNSSSDAELLAKAEGLFQAALQAGTAKFSDLMDMYQNKSMGSAIRQLRQREEEQAQSQAETQQMQQQIAQQQMEMQAQMEQQKMQLEAARMELDQQKIELEKYKIDVDAQTKITVATISAYRGAENMDIDQDLIPDPIEIQQLALKEQELQAKQMDKQLDLLTKKEMEENKNRLKEKELDMKKEIEDKKIRAVEIQNKSQEKMQEKQLKAKEKELQMKERLERIKARAKRNNSK